MKLWFLDFSWSSRLIGGNIDLLEEEYASYLIEQEINDFIDSLGKGIKKGIEEIGDFIDETAKEFEEWSNEESDLDSITLTQLLHFILK